MKAEPRPEQPLKWLLRELAQYLDGEALDTIQSDFEIVKRRYDTASKLRLAQKDLALYRRNQTLYGPDTARYKSYTVKIIRRLERIKKLEEELQ